MRDEFTRAFIRFHSSLILHPLINLRKYFAANVLAACGLAAHQSARGRDDVDAVAAEHFRNRARAHIDATPGTRHSLQMRDRACAARIVAQEDTDRALYALALDDEVVDVSLFLQDSGNLKFQFRCRDINARVLRCYSVPYARQHIGYWISHALLGNSILDFGC